MAMIVAADCEKVSDPEYKTTPAINTAATSNDASGNKNGLLPSMRNHLEEASVAQSLDGSRLEGSLLVPGHSTNPARSFAPWLYAIALNLQGLLGDRIGLRVVTTPLRPVSATINLVWHERTEADPALQACAAYLVLRKRAE